MHIYTTMLSPRCKMKWRIMPIWIQLTIPVGDQMYDLFMSLLTSITTWSLIWYPHEILLELSIQYKRGDNYLHGHDYHNSFNSLIITVNEINVWYINIYLDNIIYLIDIILCYINMYIFLSLCLSDKALAQK